MVRVDVDDLSVLLLTQHAVTVLLEQAGAALPLPLSLILVLLLTQGRYLCDPPLLRDQVWNPLQSVPKPGHLDRQAPLLELVEVSANCRNRLLGPRSDLTGRLTTEA